MRFEERELPPHAEPVSPADLQEGSVYFSVNFVDPEMLIPTVEALVYIGRDLDPDDSGQLYFQDIESYRRGVLYTNAGEEDSAQFLLEPEDSPYVFEYEKALNLLMLCSLRRRKSGGEIKRVEHGEQLVDSFYDAQVQSFRFDDPSLQARFVAELRKTELSYEVHSDGTVEFAGTIWPLLNNIARGIRDSCFRWYFMSWRDSESAHLFWKELKTSGLPFHVEHHDDRVIFVMPRGNEDLHQVVVSRVMNAT